MLEILFTVLLPVSRLGKNCIFMGTEVCANLFSTKFANLIPWTNLYSLGIYAAEGCTTALEEQLLLPCIVDHHSIGLSTCKWKILKGCWLPWASGLLCSHSTVLVSCVIDVTRFGRMIAAKLFWDSLIVINSISVWIYSCLGLFQTKILILPHVTLALEKTDKILVFYVISI